VYKHSFSCKINCTEVKYTATKLHLSPDKTDRDRSWSLLQKRDSDSGPKPGLWGSLTPHPCSLAVICRLALQADCKHCLPG